MHRFYQDASLVEDYSKFRPKYLPAICDIVIGFLQETVENDAKSKFDVMVDVGCGGGQATSQFAPYFNKVTGVDASENMILSAQKQNQFEHVTYKVGQAENLDQISDESVDLLLSAEAAHWFERPKFFAEMTRVLKPGGCVALIGYWIPDIVPTSFVGDRKALSQQNKILCVEVLQAEVKEAGAAYKSMAMKYEDLYEALSFEDKKRNDEIAVRETWTMNALAGYLRSLDVVAGYMEKKHAEIKKRKNVVTRDDIEAYDIVPLILNKLANLWGYKSKDDPSIKLDVEFDIFAVLARKP